MAQPRHAPRRAGPRAAKLEEIPSASREDLIVDGQYRMSDVIIPTKAGPRRWRVMARDLSWEQQSEISDRHTKVIEGRQGQPERKITNTTSIMREILEQMIDGPKCEPPLDKAELRTLKGPMLKAFAEHYNLTDDARQAEAKEQGESGAP